MLKSTRQASSVPGIRSEPEIHRQILPAVEDAQLIVPNLKSDQLRRTCAPRGQARGILLMEATPWCTYKHCPPDTIQSLVIQKTHQQEYSIPQS